MSSRRSARCAAGGAGGLDLRVVVDTNVWVSGLIAPDSAPGRVLQAVRDRELEPVITWELAEELTTVLRRPKLKRYRVSADDVQQLLALGAPFLPTVELQIDLRDPADVPVISAAVSGGADAIVTGDRDLLDAVVRSKMKTHGIQVLTPGELLAAIGRGAWDPPA